jgi:hypothetical protein
LQEAAERPTFFYADGGAVDRTCVDTWQAWRPGARALVHLVSSELADGSYGPRDGLRGRAAPSIIGVVRTRRARANFFSLRDFDMQVDAAAELATQGLERIGWA